VLARRVEARREHRFAPLRNTLLRTSHVEMSTSCPVHGPKQPARTAAHCVQLPVTMRNIATFVSSSLIAVTSLLVASSALAEPCEKDEERPDAECHEYETYIVPGGQATVYKAAGVEKPYIGGGFRLDVVRWSHHNGDFGPGEGSVFFQASLLKSPSSDHVLGIYEGGVTLSFERNPKRRFLIPYFGFTTGGMFADDLPKTGFFQPLGGIHLYAHPNVVADVQGGYVFPTDAVDRLHGFRAQASIRVHAW
jgi:hypothetical protein